MKQSTLVMFAALLLVGCERPLRPAVALEHDGQISLAVIAITTDSLAVSVRWGAVTDPSGIQRYEWMDTTVLPANGPVIRGSTGFLTDTLTVAKPPLNSRHEHDFSVRAVDMRGNVGPYSPKRRWALTRPDVTGPRSPDSVYIDTLVVVPEVALAVGMWPRSVSIPENGHTVIWTAMIISDDRAVCDTIGISGSLSRDTTVTYDLMTHSWQTCTSAWDSAIARARSRLAMSQ